MQHWRLAWCILLCEERIIAVIIIIITYIHAHTVYSIMNKMNYYMSLRLYCYW